jgi:beta-glucosidase
LRLEINSLKIYKIEMKQFIYFTLLFLIAACTPKALPIRSGSLETPTASEITEKSILKNPTIETTEFVANLMAKMTLEEKIGQLNLLTPGGAVTGSVVSEGVEQKIRDGQVGGIFGIRGAAKVRQAQEIAVNKSHLKIPLLVGMDVIHGHQTIFPIPLGLSCTWDMGLIEKTAQQAAREATADGLMWTFSPMVDISRDPRWGRISEGAGEDTFLSGEIAAAMVKGYQGDDFSDPETMLACVKHFANYGAAEGGRDYAATDMSRVKMFNEYLPPYKAAIDAGVETVMTSFNVIDYVPATANDFLYQKILREEWGFDGFVVTDYTAINEMIEHGMGDLQQVSALALKAGIDMDMVGEGFLTTLKKSVEEGKVTETEIDNSCRKILEAKEKLGLFDDPFKYCDAERAEKEILSAENRQFAREVAAQSFVLLKNKNNILPLQKRGKIALIGPLADSRRNMLGTWSVSGDPDKSVTVLEGIKNAVGDKAEILYAKGANISNDSVFAKRVNVFSPEIVIDKRTPETMLREALKAAEASDVVVAVMGESANMSGESSSMANIGLQPAQKELLGALQRLGKPIILVLYNGRPMTLQWESENMDAILDVWFGGTEGGNAVADVLFGEVNPSGKLTTSFPVSVGQIPVYHSVLNTGRPTGKTTNKFKSNYLDIPNEPLYPFGFGLSYTTFKYSKPSISQSILQGDNTEIIVSVEVTNTGSRVGAEVVQMYIRDVVGSISRPMKELKGFEKITLQPKETKKISFSINRELLKFYDSNLNFDAEPGAFEIFVGGSSIEVQQVDFELR